MDSLDQEQLELLFYLFPMLLVFIIYLTKYQKKQSKSIKILEENVQAGLTEPASLHPKINYSLCCGAGACISACPEGDVLGLVNGKAELINPTKCIGHGACKTACPTNAITLVFGTEKRGVEIPEINPQFETTVPGIYIAGELGGMGLIRNAVTQGTQAIDAIAQAINKTANNKVAQDMLDVVIIGAGPAGFAASLGAMEKKMNYLTIEQDSLGGTVAQFPRGKVVMTAPVILPIVGKVKFTETTKETLIAFWKQVEQRTDVKISYREKMENIQPVDGGFVVTTTKGEYKTRKILLAIGRRGTPRKLGVEGEAKTKVVYSLIDPSQYQGKHVLVVGGGDSALEAATSIAEEPGTTVTISYRSEAFGRAKQKNREKVAQFDKSGKLAVMMSSNIKKINNDTVVIDYQGQLHEIPNDGVIICAGGVLPTPFLKKIGIHVEAKYGTE